MVFIFLFFLEVSLDLHRGNSVSETAGTSLASKVMLRLCTPTAVGMVPFLVGELKKKKKKKKKNHNIRDMEIG